MEAVTASEKQWGHFMLIHLNSQLFPVHISFYQSWADLELESCLDTELCG